MVDLAVSNQFLTISNDTHTVSVDYNNIHCKAYEFNRPRDLSKECGSDNSGDTNDGNTPVVSSSFSTNGQLFVCCCQKYLTVWNVDGWKLIGKKTIQRSANKVLFSYCNNILVADKSGDVYLHLLKNFDTPGTLLLGHLSMILDILVTPDEKYIITCDRDEKIRVSSYPKSYVINSYCLGHEDFVTYIHLLPHDSSVLVSSSGDGTVKFWTYEIGKELLSHSLKDDLCELIKDDFSQTISHRGLVSKIDTNSSFLISLVFKVNAVIIYLIKNTGSIISCKLLQIVRTDYTPLCFQISQNGKLWILQQDKDKPLLGFELCSNNYVTCESNEVCNVQEAIKKCANLLKNLDLHERFIGSLEKKRFDNEGEYYKRKQERLGKKNVKRLAT